DEIALFRLPGLMARQPTSAYLGTAVLLQLLYLVATADRSITDQELHAIQEQVSGALRNDSPDRLRLQVYGQLLVRSPSAAATNLNKVTRRLDPAKREQVAQAVIHLAAADGLITENERKVLTRIIDLLALPSGIVENLLPNIAAFQEKIIVEAAPEIRGETIP